MDLTNTQKKDQVLIRVEAFSLNQSEKFKTSKLDDLREEQASDLPQTHLYLRRSGSVARIPLVGLPLHKYLSGLQGHCQSPFDPSTHPLPSNSLYNLPQSNPHSLLRHSFGQEFVHGCDRGRHQVGLINRVFI